MRIQSSRPILISITLLALSARADAQQFNDVPVDYWAASFIESIADAGITSGCGGGNYCPDDSVTRAQMAVFLERGIRGSAYAPPPASGAVFADISGSFAEAWIERLWLDGITSGCGGGNYCPAEAVTRAQMAVFILRATRGANYSPPPATGQFNDVGPGDFAAAWIEQLAADGITAGCGNGNYCPRDPVTRAQMAVFLVRAFNLDGPSTQLSSLALSDVPLDPGFDPDLRTYELSSGFLVSKTRVTATPADPAAAVMVNGAPIGDGIDVPLGEGFNAITVSVTNGGITRQYTVDVARQPAASLAADAYLEAFNINGEDEFGSMVALSGNTLVVGAAFEDSNNASDPTNNTLFGSGAVYVFVRGMDGTWEQQAFLKASNAGNGDRFGGAVAIDGDTLVVGADWEDGIADNSGAAYVFTRDGTGNWSEQQILKASNVGGEDWFGSAVDIEGDTIIVGARNEAGNGIDGPADNSENGAGAVYVFTRSGNTWTEQDYLKASNAEAFDRFGISVALDGDTLAVGASGEASDGSSDADNSESGAGAVYVFTRSGSSWNQSAYVKASNPGNSDLFGRICRSCRVVAGGWCAWRRRRRRIRGGGQQRRLCRRCLPVCEGREMTGSRTVT